MHLYLFSMALIGPVLCLCQAWAFGHLSVLLYHERGSSASGFLEGHVCLWAARGHSSPMSHLWKSPTGSCVFIWEVRSDVLPSDSMSLPSVLLFFIQGTESFLLGCINIHALVSSFQSLPPCSSPWGSIWTGWMKVGSSTALLFVVMLL